MKARDNEDVFIMQVLLYGTINMYTAIIEYICSQWFKDQVSKDILQTMMPKQYTSIIWNLFAPIKYELYNSIEV